MPLDNFPKLPNVSDYIQLGSYSGADIKVIVHYPRNSLDLRAAEQQKQSLELEHARAEKDLLASGDNLEQRYQALERLQILDKEIRLANNQVEGLQSIPTSKTLAEIQTFSWGIFREKDPVRTLGSVYPRAYTRGPRSIAGSMIFTVFHEHVFHELMKLNLRYYNTGTSDFDRYAYTTMLSDQLPPIDISFIFANEYGSISHMGLYGVEFFQEGGTFSIEDIYTENTLQYVAKDIDPMRIVEQREIDGQGITKQWTKTASDMLREKKVMSNATAYRRNPFI